MDAQSRYHQPDLHYYRQVATLSTLRVLPTATNFSASTNAQEIAYQGR